MAHCGARPLRCAYWRQRIETRQEPAPSDNRPGNPHLRPRGIAQRHHGRDGESGAAGDTFCGEQRR
jgi:hypothetical protein